MMGLVMTGSLSIQARADLGDGFAIHFLPIASSWSSSAQFWSVK